MWVRRNIEDQIQPDERGYIGHHRARQTEREQSLLEVRITTQQPVHPRYGEGLACTGQRVSTGEYTSEHRRKLLVNAHSDRFLI